MDVTKTGTGRRPDWALRIQEGSWRQCSVFRPPTDYDGLPGHLSYAPGIDWLIVCTQSCSVCGDDFDRDPLVEVMLAKELPVFDRTLMQALGRSFRELHIPVEGLPGVEALACFVSRRTHIPRELLLDWTASTATVPVPTLKSFQGWLAANYTRIALPNALVNRIRAKGGISNTVAKALKKPFGGSPLNTRVLGFYVSWAPDIELPAGENYTLSLVVACDTEETADELADELGGWRPGRAGARLRTASSWTSRKFGPPTASRSPRSTGTCASTSGTRSAVPTS